MITENDRKLGKRIQKMRDATGMKQYQFADKIGLTTKYVQFIETARRRPSLKTLYRIANALNVKVSELFPF